MEVPKWLRMGCVPFLFWATRTLVSSSEQTAERRVRKLEGSHAEASDTLF